MVFLISAFAKTVTEPEAISLLVFHISDPLILVAQTAMSYAPAAAGDQVVPWLKS